MPLKEFLKYEVEGQKMDQESSKLLHDANTNRTVSSLLAKPGKNSLLTCNGCDKPQQLYLEELQTSETMVCPICACLFCIQCDIFIH